MTEKAKKTNKKATTAKKKTTTAKQAGRKTPVKKSKEVSRTATKTAESKKDAPEGRKPVIKVDDFITDYDIYLFREGKHFSLHKKLGAHLMNKDGKEGTFFAVWAPNAKSVSVIGNFNGWLKDAHHLEARKDGSGIWEGFITGVMKGEAYKYFITSNFDNYQVEKADPVGFYSEQPPKTASITWEYTHKWKDQKWMKNRKEKNSLDGPVSVYEVHLESWRHAIEDSPRPLTYRELAEQLSAYVKDLG